MRKRKAQNVAIGNRKTDVLASEFHLPFVVREAHDHTVFDTVNRN